MSFKFYRFAAFAVILLISSSCVDEEHEYADASPHGVFEALWTLIDRNYCFFDYKQVDWNEVRTRYEWRITNNMPSHGLFQVLCEMLSELKDGHVNLSYPFDVGRYWAWRDDYPKNLDVELRETYLGKHYQISGGLKFRMLDDNIAYVVYEDFTQGIGDGNLTAMLITLAQADGMIIDVRGNSGGSLEYAQMLSSRFTNERLLVGYDMFKTGDGHNQFSKPRTEWLDPSPYLRWQKPVVVLTNRSCYSATNTFVRNMRECKRVTIMGDRTGGGSGMPFTSELPNGWTVRFSATPSFDARMQHIEFGIEPDIVCALDEKEALQGKDSMIEEARKFLR